MKALLQVGKALLMIIVFIFLVVVMEMSIHWYEHRAMSYEEIFGVPYPINNDAPTYVPSEGFINSDEVAIDIAEIYIEHHLGRTVMKRQSPFTAYFSDDRWTVVTQSDSVWYAKFGGRTRIELDRETGAIIEFVMME